jgi:hypothetical protein
MRVWDGNMYQNQIHSQYPEASHLRESQSARARAIATDVASIRMQGAEPVPEFFRIAERYVSGELSIEQFTAAIDGLRRRHGARSALGESSATAACETNPGSY